MTVEEYRWPPYEVTAGDRLRIVRRQLGMTQGALSKRLGVDDGTVAAWEAGRHLRSLTPTVARRLELLSGTSGTAAFVLGLEPVGGPGGTGLPHLDSNQEPAG